MMQPLLMRLRQQRPDAEIHVLAPAWSAPLLARMPEVAAVIENPFAHGQFDWAGRKALGRHLGKTGFTQAYVLPNSWKSALVPFFAGIPKRTGYHGEARYFLLNDRHRLDAAAMPRLVDRYAALAGPLVGPTPNPRLTSSPEQQRAGPTARPVGGTARHGHAKAPPGELAPAGPGTDPLPVSDLTHDGQRLVLAERYSHQGVNVPSPSPAEARIGLTSAPTGGVITNA